MELGALTPDAVANRPQQERRKMRMIRRLAVGFTGTSRRLGTADRRDGAGSLRWRSAVVASATFGLSRLALFRGPRLAFFCVPRLMFAARLAPAARAVPRSLARAMPARAFVMGGFSRRREVAFGARNVLADQLLDRGHGFLVERGDDGDRGAGTAGASGAADA